MKRKTLVRYFGIISVSLAIASITAVYSIIEYMLIEKREINSVSNREIPSFTVVIDAGHGGEDGGAVGVSGILEKDLNLEISKELYNLFSLTDIPVVMTRTNDKMLYEDGQENNKKTYDLKKWLEMSNSVNSPLLISIHQNKFPVEKYKGLQLYYSGNNEQSKSIAGIIQKKTSTFLQTDNKREIKKAGRSIYILHRLECPAVLVECGFLSNKEEESLLNTELYRRKIAFVIFSSVMDFMNENSESNGV